MDKTLRTLRILNIHLKKTLRASRLNSPSLQSQSRFADFKLRLKTT